MPFTLPDLAAAIRRYFEDNLPGYTPTRIAVFTAGHKKPITTYLPLTVPPPSATAADTEDEQHERDKPPYASWVLDALRLAKVPLTGTRLYDALEKAGKVVSQRTLDKVLAEMVEDGTLENPKGVRPRGYRLPEWNGNGTSH